MSLTEKPDETPERLAFYHKIDAHHLTALWTVFADIITPEPRSGCAPHCWHFAETRRWLLEAADLISAREAERRVLIMENPGLRGQSRITTSLYAGLQLVMPGEVAPAHRHSQSALRFVLEGEAAHTSVDGERCLMRYGDFVITPAWAWHDHGNESDQPMIWLDGLDIPMATLFDASFAEPYPEDTYPNTRPQGDSLARYGQNMLPADYRASSQTSPIFHYPYDRARAALMSATAGQSPDPCHGVRLAYTNPVDGGPAMPTISAFLQYFAAGFRSTPYRSTDATVYVAVEGHGCTTVGGQRFDWGPRDIVVAPSWQWVSHEASEDTVLFSFSDRVAQQKLGFWREQRDDAE